MKNAKKILGIVSAISLGVGLIGGATLFPHTETVEKQVIVNKTVEVPYEVVKNVTVEVPVEVEKIVEVDNSNLDDVLNHIYDNDGNVQYLTNDLDDDEVDQIVDRIVFINEVKNLAVDAVKKDLFDELDGETFNSVEFDEDDMERLRVDNDDDELVICDVDFEDKDAEVKVTGTFEQDDVKYHYTAIVEFKDGEYDEIKSIEISE